MKKVIAIWFAVSLVMYIVLGVTLDIREYLDRFANLQSPLVIIGDVVKSFNSIRNTLINFGNFADIFKLLGGFFMLIVNMLTLPFHLIGYLIDVIMTIIPFGLIE